jgi:protein-L-isoaspartate(D-aspartate) O-methyltransferase
MNDYKAARIAMVDCQVRPSDVTKYPIIEALLHVPREEYVPTGKRGVAYAGEHLVLSESRVLLDARTFAKMLDAVNIQPDELVLDLGCGLGYSTAVIAHLAEAVVAVEEDAALAAEASTILTDQAADNAFVVEAPLSLGAPKHGPYDVIVLQGAVQQMPATILDQLKDGGRIVALFHEEPLGQCRIGYKLGSHVDWRVEFEATAPVLPGFEKTAEFSFA